MKGRLHWLQHRVTALALLPLALWFLVTVSSLPSQGPYENFLTPHRLFFLSLFAFLGSWHGALGAQTMIEDYVHHETTKRVTLFFVRLIAASLFIITFAGVITVALRP